MKIFPILGNGFTRSAKGSGYLISKFRSQNVRHLNNLPSKEGGFYPVRKRRYIITRSVYIIAVRRISSAAGCILSHR